ncbi:hypothetical protein [Bacillus sp. AK128]
MFATFICLFIGLAGGMIAASSISPNLLSSQFVTNTILDPFSFFFGMIFFFFGFIANAKLIRGSIELTYARFKGVSIPPLQLFFSYLVIFSLTLIIFINPTIGFLFLLFSLIYGMISLKLKRYIPYVKRQEM